jgi:hypothetical protein
MARAGGGRADAFVEGRIIGLWADRSPRAAIDTSIRHAGFRCAIRDKL